MDCYSCIYWQYWDENPETHEGYGYCRNPLSDSFGSETSECDNGCNNHDSRHVDGSNCVKLYTDDSPVESSIFLISVCIPNEPASNCKWLVIKDSEFLCKSGEFIFYFKDELNLKEILFDLKDEALSAWRSLSR